MKSPNVKYIAAIAGLIASILALSASGAFAISMKTRQKAQISARIRAQEREISDIKRETEDLNVRIAQQENPIILSRRAGRGLAQTHVSGTVWVYEDAAEDRVVFSESNRDVVSLKITQKNRIK